MLTLEEGDLDVTAGGVSVFFPEDTGDVEEVAKQLTKGDPAVWNLVERFDTELFSDFSAESSNFRGLVLFCIDADFCVQILILQH